MLEVINYLCFFSSSILMTLYPSTTRSKATMKKTPSVSLLARQTAGEAIQFAGQR